MQVRRITAGELRKERRVRILWIRPETILDVLSSWQHGGHVRVPLIENLPSDFEIEQVWYEPMRRAFGLTVYSETYEVVPEGGVPPTLPDLFTVVVVPVPDKKIGP